MATASPIRRPAEKRVPPGTGGEAVVAVLIGGSSPAADASKSRVVATLPGSSPRGNNGSIALWSSSNSDPGALRNGHAQSPPGRHTPPASPVGGNEDEELRHPPAGAG